MDSLDSNRAAYNLSQDGLGYIDSELAAFQQHSNMNKTHEQDLVDFWVYKVWLPIVILAGLVGNSLNIAVLWKAKNLDNRFYTILRWLAIVDCSVILTFVTFDLVRSRLIDQTYTVIWYYSHVCFFLLRSLMCASNLLVVTLTVNRYVSICNALKKVNSLTQTCTYICLAVIAVISFLIHVPHTFETVVTPCAHGQRVSGTNATSYDWEWNDAVRENFYFARVYPVAKEVVSKFIPMLVVIVLNVLIMRAYHRGVQRRCSLKSREHETKKAMRAEKRLIILLMSASLIFVVCSMPQALVAIALRAVPPLYENNYGFYAFVHVANLIEASQYGLNFYVYSLASKDFRKNFLEVFRCCFRQKQLVSQSSVQSHLKA